MWLLPLIGLGVARAGAPAGAGVALDRHPELLQSLAVAPRPHAGEIDGPVEVDGPWLLVSTVDGVRTWQAALPVRPRTLFFHRPPSGMELWQREPGGDWSDARKLRHRRGLDDAQRAGTWEFTTRTLRVRRPAEAGPPAAGEYAVVYETATDRERGFQRELFDGDDVDFVFRSAQLDDTTRHGLFLPAPADARFRLAVPPGAVLDVDAGVLPPEAAEPGVRSDGAILRVLVDGEEVDAEPLAVDRFRRLRVDLSAAGGREVELGLVIDPGADAALDYAFLGTPTVHVPVDDPPRVVVLFVDTLRRDALSLYGAERPTSPGLDAWAADAAVFDDARSVAPWTLPSSRAMFLGTQPERWGQVDTLQERAAAAGWSTAFLSGNVYLSSNFEMDRGWGTHRCINWPTADVQVDRALAWLSDHADRPALLVLHLMDMHLPYTEPRAYRRLFAGPRPDRFRSDEFLLADVRKAVAAGGDPVRRYVRDRYDNNLRFVDDQLQRVLAVLDDDDTVVLLSDHGEEFWDHGGFEHGHTLYEELLDVPLVIRSPGIAAGRYDAPVSLMDVAPTLARIMDLPDEGFTGHALQGAIDGSDPALSAERPIAFGRPLYGLRRWGVVAGDWKYTSVEGNEYLHNLAEDPGESIDLAGEDRQRVRQLVDALGRGLERPAVLALRLKPSTSSGQGDLRVIVEAPGGITDAWAAEDPLHGATIDVERLDGDRFAITWKGPVRLAREAYVLPVAPLDDVLPGLQVTVEAGRRHAALAPTWGAGPPPPYRGESVVLFQGTVAGRSVGIDRAVVPVPFEDAIALTGVDEELQGDLEALGYVER
ncbi:MAG: hypothetical protein D6798_17205 [Deltaproteobacteria bacterium]|nr:MAG: hypothetical protein D6798_17205 [Deltaproteobacteria bacterium]